MKTSEQILGIDPDRFTPLWTRWCAEHPGRSAQLPDGAAPSALLEGIEDYYTSRYLGRTRSSA